MNPTPPIEEHKPAWYCVRTQTKREHLAAKGLSQLDGVEVFCPRIRYKKATRRGKIWWVEAMFPGYIFARFVFSEMERAVIYSHGVMSLLKFGTLVPAIPETFIHELQSIIREQENEDEEMLTLQPIVKPGDTVEIAHGAMQGVEGEVVEIYPATERVVMLIEFLGGNQLVEADIFSLLLPNKPIPDSGLEEI